MTKTTEKRTATRAFSQNAIAAKKLLGLLTEHICETDALDADWGHVGTVAHMRDQLMDLAKMICSEQGEDEEEAETRIERILEGMRFDSIKGEEGLSLRRAECGSYRPPLEDSSRGQRRMARDASTEVAAAADPRVRLFVEARRAQTPTELARELRVNHRRIYAAIHSGALNAVRIGRRWKILPEDRDAWLATLRQNNTPFLNS